MHLSPNDGHPALDGYRSFDGSQTRLAAAVALRQLSRGSRPVLFYFDHPGPARIQGRLPGFARSPFLVSILGIEVWRPLAEDRARALARAASLISISATTVARAMPFLPKAARVEVVHPGLDSIARGGEPERELLAELGRGFALIVSRLSAAERYKGHDELIDCWPRLRLLIPEARLIIAGDGDDRPRLEAKARGLGQSDAIRFIGGVTEATLDEVYRRAALFAMPSRGEGFGLVFLEAMAVGLPCIALAGTAPAEIIEPGRTGFLVEAGDVEALVSSLARLLGDPQRAAAMGEAGRRRALSEFSMEAFERRFEAQVARWLPREAR